MHVNFYQLSSGRSPVEDFITTLTAADKARFAEVIVGISQHGLNYVRAKFKPLRGKLWEIKFSAPSGGYRMAYVLVSNDEMVILHAFKKATAKTSLRDLAIAERRMKEVLRA